MRSVLTILALVTLGACNGKDDPPVGDPGVEKLFSAVLYKPATPDRVVALVQQYANA